MAVQMTNEMAGQRIDERMVDLGHSSFIIIFTTRTIVLTRTSVLIYYTTNEVEMKERRSASELNSSDRPRPA